MADNTTLNPGVGGDVIVTEDIGGVKMPCSKIYLGATGVNNGPVTTENPFPSLSHGYQMSSAYPLGQVQEGYTAPSIDAWGNLQQRGTILTDEGSLADDFSAMSTSLTGTLTFTNGSKSVTGALSFFGSELDEYHYIKLDAHDETAWVLVESVEDDGHLTLASPYTGANGTGAASTSLWKTYTQAGGSISAANSICAIAPGTSAGATGIFHAADYSPMFLSLRVALSQRIANQTTCIGFRDDFEAPTLLASFVFTGTDATLVTCKTMSSTGTGASTETTVSIPTGGNTSTHHLYEVRPYNNTVGFYIDGYKVASHTSSLPGPYTVLGVCCAITNASTVTETTLSVHEMHLENSDRVDVVANQPDADKLHATVVGPDREGQAVSRPPVVCGAVDPLGKVYANRADTAGNQRISVGDPTTGLGAAVKKAADVVGDEYGIITQGLIQDVFLAFKRPLDLIARALATANDSVGRIRAIADINGGTVTTVTTVTTCATVTTMNQLAGQSAQTTLLYDMARTNWANSVRARIS
jgi:hypothetical protein